MKNKTRKVVLGAATLAAVAVAGIPGEADAATAKVKITAEIIKALAINATKTLKFGQMTVKGTSAGTVQIKTTADTRTPAGGVSLIGGAGQRGGFSLQGAKLAVEVTAPASATLTNGTATMKVNAFRVGTASAKMLAATPFVTTLTKTAAVTGFRVGGVLNVGAGQKTGTYTGTVTLTANYQ